MSKLFCIICFYLDTLLTGGMNNETEIFNLEEKEISSTVIGEIVMNKIKDLDSVAYVRFASVYREFKDVNTFMSELKKVLER